MINLFRQRRARPLIAKALADHDAFENAHRAQMDRLLANATWTCAKEKYRTVEIDANNWFIRPHGSYDMDQKIDRIVGEVIRMLEGRKPPRDLRRLIMEAM